jgi:hypothetical protein
MSLLLSIRVLHNVKNIGLSKIFSQVMRTSPPRQMPPNNRDDGVFPSA